MKRIKTVLGTVLACTLLLSACSNSPFGNELQYVEVGKISVQLTDAPFPYDMVSEANVTIFKIDARLKSDEALEGDENDAFQVLFAGEKHVNLLELTNGVTESLGDTEVPAGSYDLVRVFVKDATILLTDGRTFDLKIPSGEQSGIKIFIAPELIVSGNLTSELLLDFDVSQSFIAKGSTKEVSEITGFTYKPVIRASNMSVAGTLMGQVGTLVEDVATDVEGAQLSILKDGEVQMTTFTDASGGYLVQGLVSGTYEVVIERNGYATQIAEEVVIVSGNETVQDFSMIVE
ncbi:DUF4382 domain-containing protein [Pareuzebyella sediminis]|uniref:DUF4382 domain-containing protein n=1 Tax=Pareuzebyella sediminis TaxID=2607998 RepID=UPI0011EC9844|nr:DUF4382 domain-containing protein [Pareuzebyella sediminis]